MLVSTLKGFKKSRNTSIKVVKKAYFNLLNAFYYCKVYINFLPFPVSLYKGLIILIKY
jgi:hypothetical protein